jgi:hypothetical protein
MGSGWGEGGSSPRIGHVHVVVNRLTPLPTLPGRPYTPFDTPGPHWAPSATPSRQYNSEKERAKWPVARL